MQIKTQKRFAVLLALGLAVLGVLFLFRNRQKPEGPATSRVSQINLPDKEISQLESLDPYSLHQITVLSKDLLLGINNSSLLTIHTQNKSTPLHPNPIDQYATAGSLVALIEETSPAQIKTFDIESKKIVNSISVPEAVPLISLSLSPDSNNLYLLGNFNSNTRRSTLYSLELENPTPVPLFETTANHVDAVNPDLLLLFEFIDGQNASTVSIFDIPSRQIEASATGNSYFLSPSRKFLLIHRSESVIVFNLETKVKREIKLPPASKINWKDDQTVLLLKNLSPGVSLSYLNLATREISPPSPIDKLRDHTARSVLKVLDDTAYVVDTDDRLWIINLP